MIDRDMTQTDLHHATGTFLSTFARLSPFVRIVECSSRRLTIQKREKKVRTTISGGIKHDFDVLTRVHRSYSRENARKNLPILSEHSEMDFVRLDQTFNIFENGLWLSVRALKKVVLLVRKGATNDGKWIVKNARVRNTEREVKQW